MPEEKKTSKKLIRIIKNGWSLCNIANRSQVSNHKFWMNSKRESRERELCHNSHCGTMCHNSQAGTPHHPGGRPLLMGRSAPDASVRTIASNFTSGGAEQRRNESCRGGSGEIKWIWKKKILRHATGRSQRRLSDIAVFKFRNSQKNIEIWGLGLRGPGEMNSKRGFHVRKTGRGQTVVHSTP